MGDVYAGHDLRLDREVAIKIMRPSPTVNDAVRHRFELEARLAARLVHPHVVAVFDSGECDGGPFLVMERLPGRTLADAITEGPLDAEQVRTLGTEVLAALGAAHEAGMVHRDVKPGNILSTRDGHWKVADFGIAKSVAAEDSTTVTGLVYGTLAYLAPERVAGGPATVATDLYATGVVLYEALSGRRPVEPGAPPSDYLAPHPIPLSQLRPGLPVGLTAPIERAMAIDPVMRFATADAMSRAIDTSAGHPGPDDRTVAFPPMGVGTDLTAPLPLPPQGPASPSPRTPDAGRRTRVFAIGALGLGALVALIVAVLVSGHGHQPTRGAAAQGPAATAAPPTPAVSLPPALESSIQRLEQTVRP